MEVVDNGPALYTAVPVVARLALNHETYAATQEWMRGAAPEGGDLSVWVPMFAVCVHMHYATPRASKPFKLNIRLRLVEHGTAFRTRAGCTIRRSICCYAQCPSTHVRSRQTRAHMSLGVIVLSGEPKHHSCVLTR